VLLTAIELCLLEPKEHGENALRLSALTTSALFNSFLAAFRDVKASRSHTTWVEGPNPLDMPELQDLMAPVLRDSVVFLVPLLLPECFDIPLPASEAADPSGSKLSALMPQQIIFTTAAGGCFVSLSVLIRRGQASHHTVAVSVHDICVCCGAHPR
jgi:hypothetical protein